MEGVIILAAFIPCVPPKATAQQKGAYAMPGGKGVRFFKKKRQKDAETGYAVLLHPYKPEGPASGPLKLELGFTYPWRKSEPKKNRVNGFKFSDTRPDVDNMAKAVIDVMGMQGFFTDDSQLSVMHLWKGWGDKPGLTVKLSHLG